MIEKAKDKIKKNTLIKRNNDIALKLASTTEEIKTAILCEDSLYMYCTMSSSPLSLWTYSTVAYYRYPLFNALTAVAEVNSCHRIQVTSPCDSELNTK